jgi:hypothetical protein
MEAMDQSERAQIALASSRFNSQMTSRLLRSATGACVVTFQGGAAGWNLERAGDRMQRKAGKGLPYLSLGDCGETYSVSKFIRYPYLTADGAGVNL